MQQDIKSALIGACLGIITLGVLVALNAPPLSGAHLLAGPLMVLAGAAPLTRMISIYHHKQGERK